MLFKDIQKGSSVFVLDKQNFTVTDGRVLSSIPRMEMNKKTGTTQMVVDVEIDIDGKVDTFTIPEHLSVTFSNNLILSTDRQSLIPEVHSICDRAQKIIEAAPSQKLILERKADILAELDPSVKERQEIDKRFVQLEESQRKLGGSVEEIKSDLKELLKKLS